MVGRPELPCALLPQLVCCLLSCQYADVYLPDVGILRLVGQHIVLEAHEILLLFWSLMISIMLILNSDLNVHPVHVFPSQFVSGEAVESRLHRAFCLRLHLGQVSSRRAYIPRCTSRIRCSKFAIDACEIEIEIVEGILAGASLYRATLKVAGICLTAFTVEHWRLSPLFVGDHRQLLHPVEGMFLRR